MHDVTLARRQIALSIALTGDEPPSEFRIFAAGEIETTKGTFLFDATAAASVIAEYEAHGIDLMVDYDHASLGSEHSPDPAQAGKAAAWFNLEVRDGELWAVNVRWTPRAAEALRQKEWRFMSPAFGADAEGRITSLLNVAITNLPATRRLQPLMAAKRAVVALGGTMDPNLVQKALDALEAGDSAAALDLLKQLIAAAAAGGADPDANTEDAPPPVGDGGADEATEPPAQMSSEDKAAVAASISRLTRITGKDTIVAAIDEVETWRQSHLKLEAETAKLAKERAAIELGKRKENAATLVKLGAETPHTSGLAKGKLVQRLLDEPLADQNARIAALLAARGGKLPTETKPPAVDDDGAKTIETKFGTVTLSAAELANCAKVGAKVEDYAANKARHLKARGSKE